MLILAVNSDTSTSSETSAVYIIEEYWAWVFSLTKSTNSIHLSFTGGSTGSYIPVYYSSSTTGTNASSSSF